MLQSLRRTWAALGLASLAVLLVALIVGRDFVRDVYPECAASLEGRSSMPPTQLEPVFLDTANPPSPSTTTPSFLLLFDQKRDARGWGTQYSNVRIVWNDSHCNCGSLPVYLPGESPYDLRLYRSEADDSYFVNDEHWELRAVFALKSGAARHLQPDRVVTMHHLPALVIVFAIGALVVALFRSRRAMSYALRLHAWTEARLTPGGLIESEHGASLGMLSDLRELVSCESHDLGEQRSSSRIPSGPILVAPEALRQAGLYRDMPIVPPHCIAEGTHTRWVSGTMVRLRDARALAIISTACTLMAFGARAIS